MFDFRYAPAGEEEEAAPAAGGAAAPAGGEAAAPAGGNAAAPAGDDAAAGGAEDPADAVGGDAAVPVPDEQTPQALQDLDQIEDEAVPEANLDANGNRGGTRMSYLPIYIGIGAAAIAALAATVFYLAQRVGIEGFGGKSHAGHAKQCDCVQGNHQKFTHRVIPPFIVGPRAAIPPNQAVLPGESCLHDLMFRAFQSARNVEHCQHEEHKGLHALAQQKEPVNRYGSQKRSHDEKQDRKSVV